MIEKLCQHPLLPPTRKNDTFCWHQSKWIEFMILNYFCILWRLMLCYCHQSSQPFFYSIHTFFLGFNFHFVMNELLAMGRNTQEMDGLKWHLYFEIGWNELCLIWICTNTILWYTMHLLNSTYCECVSLHSEFDSCLCISKYHEK